MLQALKASHQNMERQNTEKSQELSELQQELLRSKQSVPQSQAPSFDIKQSRDLLEDH